MLGALCAVVSLTVGNPIMERTLGQMIAAQDPKVVAKAKTDLEKSDNDNAILVCLGDSSELNMIGYNIPAGGSVYLPMSQALQVLFRVFNKWEICGSEQAKLLSISISSLSRYRHGVLPQRNETISRIEDILITELLLNVLFPAELAGSWIIKRNKAFGDTTPIDYAFKHGTTMIRKYLEGQVYGG